MIDANVSPKYDVPLWNETRWNGCWNSEAGVGIYIHAGRLRHDLDLWWAQVAAYLPDGQLCVQRLWGRNASDAGVTLAGLAVEMTDDGWTASFDGAGQLTTTTALARAAQGSSAPVRRLRFEIAATQAAPAWDMYATTSGRQDFAGDAHVQQGFHATGMLRIGTDADYSLDGIGFKDHSSGPRDFRGWYGHRFFMIVTEAWTVHAIVMYTPDGQPLPPLGVRWRDGTAVKVTRFELPELSGAAGAPQTAEAVIELENGESYAFATELVHALPVMITLENENINGVDWELDGDPLVLVEGKGRLTAPDGTVAHCFHERSALRSRVARV